MPVHNVYTMALAAGFEPANPFELPVFKTGGLNRTLPSKHIKVVATKLRMATQNITTMFFRKKIKSKYKHSPFEKNYHCYWWWYAHLESNQEIPKITAAYKTGTLTIV